MVRCVVPMCKTNSNIDKKMSFHQFPSDEKRLHLWLQNLNKTNPTGTKWIINQYSTVCGLHFMESDFKPSLKNRVLKPDAVPTIFPSSKDSKQNVSRQKRKRKASIPKKTPNKEKEISDENVHLIDIDNNSGSAAELDQAASEGEEQDEVGLEEEQDQVASEEEEEQAAWEEEQDQAGSYKEHNQAVSDEDQAGFEAEHGQADSDAEPAQAGSDVELGQAGMNAELGQTDLEAEEYQVDGDLENIQADMTENIQTNTYSEPKSKKAKVDSENLSSEVIYPISKQFYTPKHLKTLIRESKVKCAEKKLAIVKEKLASKVVSRALQKALVVSKIKAETAKTDFYERKKIFLLQTKISHLKNEVPVSEEKFQTLEYLQSKIMEEELATRIEERALQKQLFEAEIQASNEKQTYYVTKKTWLPIFMDHSNMK